MVLRRCYGVHFPRKGNRIMSSTLEDKTGVFMEKSVCYKSVKKKKIKKETTSTKMAEIDK